jgi:hypothetical protein
MLLVADARSVFRARLLAFVVESFPKGGAVLHEIAPVRHGWSWLQALRQDVPQLRDVPAEVVPVLVPLLANSGPQLAHFGAKLVEIHGFEIIVHGVSLVQPSHSMRRLLG